MSAVLAGRTSLAGSFASIDAELIRIEIETAEGALVAAYLGRDLTLTLVLKPELLAVGGAA